MTLNNRRWNESFLRREFSFQHTLQISDSGPQIADYGRSVIQMVTIGPGCGGILNAGPVWGELKDTCFKQRAKAGSLKRSGHSATTLDGVADGPY